MIAQTPTPIGQLQLNIQIASQEETALNVLRKQYLRNNGDLSAFMAELSQRQPLTKDPSEGWTLAGRVFSKSLR